MKPRRYIKNGFLDIRKCVMFKGDRCDGLKEVYCLTEDYDCPFFKTAEMLKSQLDKIEMRRMGRRM